MTHDADRSVCGLRSAAQSRDDMIDRAMTALSAQGGLALTPYVAELDRDDAGTRLSEALGEIIAQRHCRREPWFVHLPTGSAVWIVLDVEHEELTAFMAEYIAPGTFPQFDQRLVDAATSR